MLVRRTAISLAIAVFWLAMMGLLVRDYVAQRRKPYDLPELSPERLTEQWRDFEEWMTLKIGRRSEGVSYTTIRRLAARAGYLACNRTWLELDILGRHTFRLQTVALLDSAFYLRRAFADVRLDESQMHFTALVTRAQLLYRWQYEEQTRVGFQNLERPISLLEAVRPLVGRHLDLKVGTVRRVPVLDSTWSLHEGWAEVRVEARERIPLGGKTVEAYRLAIQLGRFTSTIWVNEQGEALRRQFANITMERVEPQEARERFPGIDAPVETPSVKVSDFQLPEGESTSLGENVGPLSLLLNLFRQPPNDR